MPTKKKPEDRIMADLAAKVSQITAAGDRQVTSRRPLMIDDALKAAIKKSGLTHYALGKEAGVAPSVIDRFMVEAGSGERGGDLRISTAAKIAAAMGLELR